MIIFQIKTDNVAWMSSLAGYLIHNISINKNLFGFEFISTNPYLQSFSSLNYKPQASDYQYVEIGDLTEQQMAKIDTDWSNWVFSSLRERGTVVEQYIARLPYPDLAKAHLQLEYGLTEDSDNFYYFPPQNIKVTELFDGIAEDETLVPYAREFLLGFGCKEPIIKVLPEIPAEERVAYITSAQNLITVCRPGSVSQTICQSTYTDLDNISRAKSVLIVADSNEYDDRSNISWPAQLTMLAEEGLDVARNRGEAWAIRKSVNFDYIKFIKNSVGK